MKHLWQFAFFAGAALFAQAPRAPESLASWPYYKEIQPGATQTGLIEVVLDRDTLDKARPDDADLRLYDNAGREIPYVLRIRREVNVHDEYEGREFNQAVKGGTAQVSIDLGPDAHEHNQVLIDTAGTNFRRFAEVEGSADGNAWATLASRAVLFRFSADGRSVEQNAIAYPVSRYRFLRVSVERDPQTDQDPPEIKGVRVRRLIAVKGELTGVMGSVEGRQSDRLNGRAASIWRMDLGGRIPVERIIVSPAFGDYSRPFQLESIDDDGAAMVIASGELTHRDQSGSPPTIEFAEQITRHLKLTVTDDRNEALHISSVTAMGAARQVVFEASAAAGPGPLRLYYGNQNAPAPHYDLGTRIPSNAAPARRALGEQIRNPTFRPEPKPFSERQPWVVYVVLIVACAALAWLLAKTARAASSVAQVS